MNLVGIAPRRGTRGEIEGEHEAASAGHLPEALRRVADDVAHRERLGAELDLSRLDPGQIEQVGDHPAEPIGIVPDPGEIVRRLLGQRAGDAVEEIVHEALVALGTDLSRPRTT